MSCSARLWNRRRLPSHTGLCIVVGSTHVSLLQALEDHFLRSRFQCLRSGAWGGGGGASLEVALCKFPVAITTTWYGDLDGRQSRCRKVDDSAFPSWAKILVGFYWRSIKRKKCLVAPIQTDIGDDGSHRINSLKTEQDRGRTVAVDKRLHLYFIFEEQTPPKLSIHASLNCPCIQEPTSHMLLRKRRR